MLVGGLCMEPPPGLVILGFRSNNCKKNLFAVRCWMRMSPFCGRSGHHKRTCGGMNGSTGLLVAGRMRRGCLLRRLHPSRKERRKARRLEVRELGAVYGCFLRGTMLNFRATA